MTLGASSSLIIRDRIYYDVVECFRQSVERNKAQKALKKNISFVTFFSLLPAGYPQLSCSRGQLPIYLKKTGKSRKDWHKSCTKYTHHVRFNAPGAIKPLPCSYLFTALNYCPVIFNF
jgi:hypothetical protein